MQISFAAPAIPASGAWIVAACSESALFGAALKADRAGGGALTRALKHSRFKGKPGQILEVLAPPGTRVSRIVLVGLGRAAALTAPRLEEAVAAVVGRLACAGDALVTFEIDLPKGAKLKAGEAAAHIGFAARLKNYRFNHYRTKNLEEHQTAIKAVTILTPDAAGARKAWRGLCAVADGALLARDLVNEPPNILYPAEFARRCKTLSRLGVKVEVLGEAAMKKLGFGALLSVGQGSVRESQLVVMQWNGIRGKKSAPVAFVGKGVCFDSGGLSLKSGHGMMGMKGDMGGAAAVTGTIAALATRKAKVHAVGVIGVVENMPDGGAIRPDDVLKSLSGQTIEVLNTDAEGRLVLADALAYTQRRFKPKFVVDLATLTGAIVQALGADHAGLFSNDDKLAERLAQAGAAVGEKVWRMPMGSYYDKMIRSKIADVKNIGGANSGSITAAQFLKRFIDDKTVWAHLDIAGVAWQDGEQKPLIPSWGTGWGVRILNRLIEDHYEG